MEGGRGRTSRSRTSSRRGSASSTASGASGFTETTKRLLQESSEFGKSLEEAAKNKKQSKVSQFLKGKGPKGEAPAKPKQDFRAHRTAATVEDPAASAATSSSSSWAQEVEESAGDRDEAAQAEEARRAAAAATAAAATAPAGSATAAVAAVVLAATAGAVGTGDGPSKPGNNDGVKELLDKQTDCFLKEARKEQEQEAMEEEDDDFITVQRRKPGHRPREVREIGTTLTDRNRRGETPFKDLGGSAGSTPGYFTAGYREAHEARMRRNAQERVDRFRAAYPKIQVILSDQQLEWFRKKNCLNCGAPHIVFSCTKERVSKERARALLNAAQRETGFVPKPRPDRQGPRLGATAPNTGRTSAPVATATATAAAPSDLRSSGEAMVGAKRTRDPAPSGTTPAAKRSKPWSKVAKTSHLTLYVREKEGNALTEARYRSLREGFNKVVLQIFRESKGTKLPPCVNDWSRTNDVVKITMASEGDRNWMKSCLSSYLVQDEQEWKLSRGRVYCGYVTDQHDPDVAALPYEDLADLIQIGRAKVAGLTAPLRLKAAPRSSRGRILQVVMD